jgi:NitT/TauT family transport system substrate-binding protein
MALALGEKVGIFAHYGIKVNLKPASNINVIIANLHGNHQQLGYLSVPLLLKADEAGQNLKCVSRLGPSTIVNPAYPQDAVMVAKNSPVKNLGQLSGKTVALNQLAGSNELLLQAGVSQAGGSMSSIKLATVPFADMSAALKSGTVQAAFEVQPFIKAGQASGDQRLLSNLDPLTAGWTTDCYAATTSYINSHKTVINNFVTAESQSILYAKAHPQDALAEIGPVSGLSPAAAKASVPPKTVFTNNLGPATIIQYGNFMRKFKALSGPTLTQSQVAYVAPGEPATKLLFGPGGKFTG